MAETDNTFNQFLERIRTNTVADGVDITYGGVLEVKDRFGKLSPEQITQLCEAVKKNKKIIGFDFNYTGIGDKGLEALKNGLGTYTGIKKIQLHKNNLSAVSVETLKAIVKNNLELGDLVIGANTIGAEGVKTLLDSIKQRTNLTRIDLRGTGIDDEGIQKLIPVLKNNTGLRELYVGNNKNITLSGIQALKEALKDHEELRFLHLDNLNLGTEGIRSWSGLLKKNNSLSHIYLGGNQLGKEGIGIVAESLKQRKNIKTLSLHNNNLEINGIKSLAKGLEECKEITYLNFNSNALDNDCIETLIPVLQKNLGLKDLHLGGNNLGHLGAEYLAEGLKKHVQIKSLHLQGNAIGVEGLQALLPVLKNNGILDYLHLQKTNLGEKGGQLLLEWLDNDDFLPSLTTLYINDNGITPKTIKAIQDKLDSRKTKVENKALKAFYDRIINDRLAPEDTHFGNLLVNTRFGKLSPMQITKLCEAVKKNRNVFGINFTGAGIGDAGLAALEKGLGKDSQIKRLHLSANHLTGASAGTLQNLYKHSPLLEDVIMNGNHLGATGVKTLLEGLKQHKNLVRIDLRDTGIDDEGIQELVPMLKNNTGLRELYVGNNSKITVSGIQSLTEGLQNLQNLQILHFDNLQLGAEGMGHLSEILKKNKSLRSLHFGGTLPGNGGIKRLTESLKEHDKIGLLMLYRNNLGSGEITLLKDIVTKNKSLKQFDLGGNNIRFEDIQKLAGYLKDHKNLMSILLQANALDDASIQEIIPVLQNNPGLNNLHLGENIFGNDGAKYLAQGLAKHEKLVTIHLHNNNIGPDGLNALIPVLKQQKELTTLHLKGNHLGEKGGQLILQLLKEGGLPSIQLLSLENTGISPGIIKEINHLLKNRKKDTIELAGVTQSSALSARVTALENEIMAIKKEQANDKEKIASLSTQLSALLKQQEETLLKEIRELRQALPTLKKSQKQQKKTLQKEISEKEAALYKVLESRSELLAESINRVEEQAKAHSNGVFDEKVKSLEEEYRKIIQKELQLFSEKVVSEEEWQNFKKMLEEKHTDKLTSVENYVEQVKLVQAYTQQLARDLQEEKNFLERNREYIIDNINAAKDNRFKKELFKNPRVHAYFKTMVFNMTSLYTASSSVQSGYVDFQTKDGPLNRANSYLTYLEFLKFINF